MLTAKATNSTRGGFFRDKTLGLLISPLCEDKTLSLLKRRRRQRKASNSSFLGSSTKRANSRACPWIWRFRKETAGLLSMLPSGLMNAVEESLVVKAKQKVRSRFGLGRWCPSEATEAFL